MRRTGVRRDVLSDVLREVHLTGAVYFDFDLSSPWVLEAPPSREIAGPRAYCTVTVPTIPGWIVQ